MKDSIDFTVEIAAGLREDYAKKTSGSTSLQHRSSVASPIYPTHASKSEAIALSSGVAEDASA